MHIEPINILGTAQAKPTNWGPPVVWSSKRCPSHFKTAGDGDGNCDLANLESWSARGFVQKFRIGLREKLQETLRFERKNGVSSRFSLKRIHLETGTGPKLRFNHWKADEKPHDLGVAPFVDKPKDWRTCGTALEYVLWNTFHSCLCSFSFPSHGDFPKEQHLGMGQSPKTRSNGSP